MQRTKVSLGIFLLASFMTFAPLSVPSALWGQSAVADDASDALTRCDALASHPHDPDRDAPGVSDEQLVPRQAIEACAAATRSNPDVARAWFELGRAYWNGQRDEQAFRAFVEAAKRNYAPAMKYIGDAYLEGRGLPSGQQQDIRAALKWYKQSGDGGFSDGTAAVREAEGYLRSHEFDLSIFQNKPMMSRLYSGNIAGANKREFTLYVAGFIQTIGGTEPFFVNGQRCIPLVAGTTTGGVTKLMREITSTPVDGNYFGNVFGKLNSDATSSFVTLLDQGNRDAIQLFNRYGCDGQVPHTVLDNINAFFDPNGRRDSQPSPPVRESALAPSNLASTSQSTGTLRSPQWFDCAKASRGADYVICASPVLLDAVARLEDAYQEAESAQGDAIKPAHKAWLQSYSESCGLPARGSPNDSQITSARDCVLRSINKRIAELQVAILVR